METMTINLSTKALFTNPRGEVTETWYTSTQDEVLQNILDEGLEDLSSRINPDLWHAANLSTLVNTLEEAEKARQAFVKLQEITGFVGNITEPKQVNTRNGVRYSLKLWKDKTKSRGITIDI